MHIIILKINFQYFLFIYFNIKIPTPTNTIVFMLVKIVDFLFIWYTFYETVEFHSLEHNKICISTLCN